VGFYLRVYWNDEKWELLSFLSFFFQIPICEPNLMHVCILEPITQKTRNRKRALLHISKVSNDDWPYLVLKTEMRGIRWTYLFGYQICRMHLFISL